MYWFYQEGFIYASLLSYFAAHFWIWSLRFELPKVPHFYIRLKNKNSEANQTEVPDFGIFDSVSLSVVIRIFTWTLTWLSDGWSWSVRFSRKSISSGLHLLLGLAWPQLQGTYEVVLRHEEKLFYSPDISRFLNVQYLTTDELFVSQKPRWNDEKALIWSVLPK